MMQPGMAEFVARFDEVIPSDMYTLPISEQRRLYRQLPTVFPYRRPDDVTVRDMLVSGPDSDIPVRCYTPAKRRTTGVLCYSRGDGFSLGSLDTHDTVAAELAAKTGYLTVFADVRLAPEHKFPAAVHDLRAVIETVSVDPELFGAAAGPIGLVGDSSGGNLVVANCLLAREKGWPAIARQALVSPVLDFARWRTGGEDVPILSAGEMEFYAACYVHHPDELFNPAVSPLRSATFENLPPATILATELDSLKEDAIEYARLLRAAGIAVDLTIEPGLVHAPLRARGMCPAAARAWDNFCASITLPA
jgi:acetyl esterase/lipase